MTTFHQVVERLNIVSVAGLIAASAAYLWANRLLPVAQDGRAVAGMAVFFGAWLATGVHAAARPVAAGWREQLWVAALLCLALPLLDAISGEGRSGPRLREATGCCWPWTSLPR